MWSKLSEYAEGIAEIVAQADATAAAAVAADGAGGPAPLSRDGATDSGGGGDAPPRSSKGEELWSRFASIVAPPSSSAGAGAAPLSQRGDDAAAAAAARAERAPDENEQEQYICELERALLQRKKQNEALEKRAYELEFRSEQELRQERAQFAQQLREKDKRIAELTREVEQLWSEEQPDSARAEPATVEKVALLEQRLRDLNARCNEDGSLSLVTAESPLERALLLFLARHDELLPGASVAAAGVEETEAKLRRLSERITRDASAATEATRLQAKVQALAEQDEEQLKKILHLQAQVSSMQASADKAGRSRQDTASKEAELLEAIGERDADVRRLEANVAQLKASMEHLAEELREAQNYADELEAFCRRQKKELEAQRTRVKELELLKAALEAQREQEREARARAAEFEQRCVRLLAEIEDLKAESADASQLLVASAAAHAASAESQAIFALEARLSASEADKAVALQDVERLQASVDALEGVLHQFQVDQKQQRGRLFELEAALAAARDELAARKSADAHKTTHSSESESDLQRVMEVLAKKTLECDQLREALETTAARYSADNDVLDKRLAAQLVVAYCETEKKVEVLQLIAGMMGFSEEQKRRVGLGFPVEGNGGGGLFSSLLGLVAPPPGGSAAVPVDIDGKSFSDIWTEFLINEAKK
ncbi:hypothetical protein PybrP1_004237 [[Pythium] brassicae (nom. inval.)]|nr:hypothetical protein PybrP1_004237 [[Pythium] brassicae (nom. inval.)]